MYVLTLFVRNGLCVSGRARLCVCVCMAGDRLLNANLFYIVSFLRGMVSFFCGTVSSFR